MPKYCPECGHKLLSPTVKFCGNCGHKLVSETRYEKESETKGVLKERDFEEEEEISKINLKTLGGKFETVVETILKAQGYKTERNKKIQGKSGMKREIDILATRKVGNQEFIMAVECKNYSHSVPIKDIVYFIDVLKDIGIKNALFATFSTFTEGARQRAEQHGIRLWEREDIYQQYLLASVGRLGAIQTEKFRFALSEKITFEEATSLHIKNPEKVSIYSAKLIWRPFYKIKYKLQSSRYLPNKELIKVKDSDICIIDAIDGKILYPQPVGGENVDFSTALKIIKKKIKETVSGDISRTDKFINELKNEPSHDYICKQHGEYEIRKIKPNIGKREAKKLAILAIVDKNTREYEYEVKIGVDEWGEEEYETRYYKFVPKQKEILLEYTRLIFVPKWEIEFNSGEHTYLREILAHSGRILTDSISICPKHVFKDTFKFSKKSTIAVCEECGEALCEKHIFQCPICGRWYCEEHSIQCIDCGKRFCRDHISKKCHICESYVCNECVYICPICGREFCKRDGVICSECLKRVCEDCAIPKRKLIKRFYVCKSCIEN